MHIKERRVRLWSKGVPLPACLAATLVSGASIWESRACCLFDLEADWAVRIDDAHRTACAPNAIKPRDQSLSSLINSVLEQTCAPHWISARMIHITRLFDTASRLSSKVHFTDRQAGKESPKHLVQCTVDKRPSKMTCFGINVLIMTKVLPNAYAIIASWKYKAPLLDNFNSKHIISFFATPLCQNSYLKIRAL